MKNFTLLCLGIFLCLIVITSCQKGLKDYPAEVNNAVHADNHANVTSAGMHFGVLVNAAYPRANPRQADTLSLLSFEKKISLASFYGVKYIRMAITHDAWVYTNASKTFVDNFEAANNAGFSVLLNVNYHLPPVAGAKIAFADENDYVAFLKQVLDAIQARNPMLKPALVVVENEETNPNSFKINSAADGQRYIDLLKGAIAECAPRNIKVTNGGITCDILTMLTWDWLKTKYNSTTADNWAKTVMAPNVYQTLNSPVAAAYITLGKSMISSYATLPLSYVNIHWYEPLKASQFAEGNLGNPYLSTYNIDSTKITAGALDSCVSYLNAVVGMNVISNETGQLSRSTRLTALLLRKYFFYQVSSSNFPIVCWYDGDADGATKAKALHNAVSSDSFNIRGMGNSFHNNLQQ